MENEFCKVRLHLTNYRWTLQFLLTETCRRVKIMNKIATYDMIRRFYWDYNHLIFTGARDNKIKVYSLIDSKANYLETLSVHNNPVRSLAIYQNYLISGGDEKGIRIWDVEEMYKIVKTIPTESSGINYLLIFQSKYLISGDDDGTITLYDASKDFTVINSKNYKHNKPIWYLATFNSTLVSSGKECTIKVWVFDHISRKFEIQVELYQDSNSIWAIAIYKANLVFTGDANANINVWDAGKGYEKVKVISTLNEVFALEIYKDYLCSGGFQAGIKVWDIKGDFELIKSIYNEFLHLLSLKIKGKYLLYGTKNGTLTVLDIESDFTMIFEYNGHISSILRII